jgi:chromosome segregation ATPase
LTDELEKMASKHAKEIIEKNNHIKSTNEKFVELEQVLVKSEFSRYNLQDEIEKLKSGQNGDCEMCEENKSKMKQLKDEMKQLKLKVVNPSLPSCSQCSKTEESLSEALQKVKVLNEKVEVLQEENTSLNSKRGLESDMRQSRTRQPSEYESKKLQIQIDDLASVIKRKDAEIMSYEDNLKTLKHKLEQMKSNISSNETEISELNEKIRAREEEIMEVREWLAECESDLEKRDAEVLELMSKLHPTSTSPLKSKNGATTSEAPRRLSRMSSTYESRQSSYRVSRTDARPTPAVLPTIITSSNTKAPSESSSATTAVNSTSPNLAIVQESVNGEKVAGLYSTGFNLYLYRSYWTTVFCLFFMYVNHTIYLT